MVAGWSYKSIIYTAKLMIIGSTKMVIANYCIGNMR